MVKQTKPYLKVTRILGRLGCTANLSSSITVTAVYLASESPTRNRTKSLGYIIANFTYFGSIPLRIASDLAFSSMNCFILSSASCSSSAAYCSILLMRWLTIFSPDFFMNLSIVSRTLEKDGLKSGFSSQHSSIKECKAMGAADIGTSGRCGGLTPFLI